MTMISDDRIVLDQRPTVQDAIATDARAGLPTGPLDAYNTLFPGQTPHHRIVVLGDAGEALGDSLYEVRIYVRGSVKGLGADCIEKDLRDEHAAELRELLEAAGAGDADPSGFRRYGSARRLYKFNVDHAGEY